MSSRSSSDEDDAPSIPAPLPAVQAVDLAASNEASATASPTVDVPRDLMADVFGSGSELTESEADDEEAPIRRRSRSPSEARSASSISSGASQFSLSRKKTVRRPPTPPSESEDEVRRSPSPRPKKKVKRREEGESFKRKKRKDAVAPVGSDDELPEMDEATRRKLELSARIESIGKGMKKKRKMKKSGADGETDLTADVAVDTAVEKTREDMERAVRLDRELNESKKAAVHKVRMLPKVLSVMQNVTMQQAILDSSEFLQSIKAWLEPLGDGSLPSLNIQRSILVQLKKMDITKENLKESGLGKVIFFYTRSKRVQPEISRIANDLYDRWSRLILNQGASERQVQQRALDIRDDEDEEMDRSEDEQPAAQRRKRRDPGAQLLNRRVEERDAEDGEAKTTRLPSQIGHAYHEPPRPIKGLHSATEQQQMESRLREHEKLNRFKRKAMMARGAR